MDYRGNDGRHKMNTINTRHTGTHVFHDTLRGKQELIRCIDSAILTISSIQYSNVKYPLAFPYK